jgi:hypothetical protein
MTNTAHAYRGSEFEASSLTEERLNAHIKTYRDGSWGATPRTGSSAASRAETPRRQTPATDGIKRDGIYWYRDGRDDVAKEVAIDRTVKPPSFTICFFDGRERETEARCLSLHKSPLRPDVAAEGNGDAVYPNASETPATIKLRSRLTSARLTGLRTSAVLNQIAGAGIMFLLALAGAGCAITWVLCAAAVLCCRLLLWALTLLWELCKFILPSSPTAPAVALTAAVYEWQLAGPLWAFWGVSAGCSAPSSLGRGLMCAATVVFCKSISDARARSSEWRRTLLD